MLTSRSRLRRLCAVLLVSVIGKVALAQVAWIGPDARIHDDLQLLSDRAVIRAPLGSWPLPLAELERILDSVSTEPTGDAAATQALGNLRALRDRLSLPGWHGDYRVSVGDPARLRGAVDTARENNELQLSGTYSTTRVGATLSATAVTLPADGQKLRLDGSHLTSQLGNWLLSANELDRLWGPSGESSLILSNNARPMPALSLDRARSTASTLPVLRWFGPWRLTALIAQMDQNRKDVAHPIFMGLRVAAQPLPGLDLGLSRTFQLCGANRRCSPKTFWDALIGHDNVGAIGGNVSAADQPGNQLAGWDIRAASPWQAVPLAYYVQMIGEDQKNLRPTSRLSQHGLEAWWSWQSGASLRAYFEYVDTVCGSNSGRQLFNCAYTNNVFNQDGYRYRGRVIGHSADADSLLRVVGMRFHDTNNRTWGIRFRTGTLNRDGGFDPNHSTSKVASHYQSVDWSLRGPWREGEFQLQLGHERQTPRGGQADSGYFGFAGWRHSLN